MRARQVGGAEAEQTIRSDARFAPIMNSQPYNASPSQQRSLKDNMLNLPGVLPPQSSNP